MKRLFLFVILILFCTLYAMTQVNGGKQTKLAKLLAEKEYEDCLFKADNLSYKDDFKNDPEVYLYMSICLFEISKIDDPDYKEDYPNAYRDAVKHAIKCKQKDKKKTFCSQNTEYLGTLKMTGIESAKELYNQKNWKYSSRILKELEKLDPYDLHIQIIRQVCDIISGNPAMLDEFKKNLNKIKEIYKSGENLPDRSTKNQLVDAFMIYSNHLIETKKTEEAKSLLSTAVEILPDDGFIKIQYNMVNGIK